MHLKEAGEYSDIQHLLINWTETTYIEAAPKGDGNSTGLKI